MGSWTLRVSVSETKGALKGLGKELEHQKLRDLNIYQDYSAGSLSVSICTMVDSETAILLGMFVLYASLRISPVGYRLSADEERSQETCNHT